MRADRLLATLLMLQSRGQVTAAEVAAELEVSERTARRDLEALGMAGVPVYSRQGRNGGWQLLGGARTDLSGLTAPEARALFLVAGPASAATPQVKAALRKLLRALPETFRDDAEAASSAVIVDHAAWGRPSSIRPTPITSKRFSRRSSKVNRSSSPTIRIPGLHRCASPTLWGSHPRAPTGISSPTPTPGSARSGSIGSPPCD